MYSLEEVRRATLEYFNGDELATTVWINKYALKDREGNIYELTPTDMHRRLAKEFVRIESKYQNPLSEQEIFNLLDRFKYIVPGGSPMEGIGNNYKIQSLSNCYVIGNNEDSYGSIMKIDEEGVHIMRRRGGVGSDLSHLRPKAAHTTCAALTSTGIVPFAERYSNSTRETAQDGRRGARMLSLSINHPDAEDFIDSKLEQGKITGANISIKITDEFMEAIRRDLDFHQTFPINMKIPMSEYHNNIISNLKINHLTKIEDVYIDDKFVKVGYIKNIKARKLWNKIIHNAWKSAEPGVLFIDTIQKESPSDCYGTDWESVSCNPCGEIPMNPYSSCILLAINLYSYVENSFTSKAIFNFDLFKQHVGKAQRLIDDIVDLEIEKINQILDKVKSDPEEEDTKIREINLWNKIKEKIVEGRRTGLGITAEGDMLAALGLRYGTEQATNFSEEIHKIMAIESYKSSIELAKERGAFKIWDRDKEYDNPFIERIIGNFNHNELHNYLYNGRRNIANLTIAPTGSVSILTQTTSGIEPAFNIYYKRRRKVNDKSQATFIDEVGDMWEEYRVFHHKFVEWFRINYEKSVPLEFLKNLDEVTLKEYIKESPYYKATSVDVDYLEKVRMQGKIQKWIDHSISVTVNMPEDVSEQTVADVYSLAHEVGCKGMTIYREGSRSGVLISDKKKEKEKSDDIIYTSANKRPETLICDIYNISRNKQPYTIIVGKLNNRPYEIFVLEKLSNQEFCDKILVGTIKKVKSKTYQLDGEINNKHYRINNIVDFMSIDEQKNTRKYSLMLRHGIKPKFIIEQIQEYATISSFDKVIAKVLSNYLEGEKVKGEELCPICGGELKNESGCNQCTNPECGWSKCG